MNFCCIFCSYFFQALLDSIAFKRNFSYYLNDRIGLNTWMTFVLKVFGLGFTNQINENVIRPGMEKASDLHYIFFLWKDEHNYFRPEKRHIGYRKEWNFTRFIVCNCFTWMKFKLVVFIIYSCNSCLSNPFRIPFWTAWKKNQKVQMCRIFFQNLCRCCNWIEIIFAGRILNQVSVQSTKPI